MRNAIGMTAARVVSFERGLLPSVRFPTAALVAAAALAGCGSVPPPAIGHVPQGMHARADVVYYDVTGSSPQEILVSMRNRGPSRGNRTYFGFHEWNIRWWYRYAPGGAGCRLTSIRVELTSTLTLPRWRPPDGASADLVAAWDEFSAAVLEHERGHQAYAGEAAREVLRMLRALRGGRNCEMLGRQANAVGQRILERYRELNRRYDGETRGGATQGVVWPPDRR